MVSHSEHLDDLRLFAQLLAKADEESNAFETVFYEVEKSDYEVSLFQFVEAFDGVELSSEMAERLEPVRRLAHLTFPHTPELVPFGWIWAATFKPEQSGYVDHDNPMTVRAVLSLRSSDEIDLDLKMKTECVIERAAAAYALGRLHDADEYPEPGYNVDPFEPVFAAYWGPDSITHARTAYLDALDGDTIFLESDLNLDSLPIRGATECTCIPPLDALSVLMDSGGWESPMPPRHLAARVKSQSNGVWSTENAPRSSTDSWPSSGRDDYFRFAIENSLSHQPTFDLRVSNGPLAYWYRFTWSENVKLGNQPLFGWSWYLGYFEALSNLVDDWRGRRPENAEREVSKAVVWTFHEPADEFLPSLAPPQLSLRHSGEQEEITRHGPSFHEKYMAARMCLIEHLIVNDEESDSDESSEDPTLPPGGEPPPLAQELWGAIHSSLGNLAEDIANELERIAQELIVDGVPDLAPRKLETRSVSTSYQCVWPGIEDQTFDRHHNEIITADAFFWRVSCLDPDPVSQVLCALAGALRTQFPRWIPESSAGEESMPELNVHVEWRTSLSFNLCTIPPTE